MSEGRGGEYLHDPGVVGVGVDGSEGHFDGCYEVCIWIVM